MSEASYYCYRLFASYQYIQKILLVLLLLLLACTRVHSVCIGIYEGRGAIKKFSA